MPLEFRRVTPELASALGDFLEALAAENDPHFTPHPMTREEAERIARYAGNDEYYLLLDGSRALGYAMLRGWDEGYEVPSIGLAVAPDARGQGLGRLLMHLLHAAARVRGATRTRLRVAADNESGIRLYSGLGYVFSGEERGQRVGVLEL